MTINHPGQWIIWYAKNYDGGPIWPSLLQKLRQTQDCLLLVALAEWFLPLRYFIAGVVLFWRFYGLLRIMDIIDVTSEGQMRAPAFFVNEDDSEWMEEGPISAFAYFIAVIFGALHLAGWNFFHHIERRYLARCLYHRHIGGGSWIYCSHFWPEKDLLY